MAISENAASPIPDDIALYADDIALVAENEQDLQQALTIIDETFIQWGMLSLFSPLCYMDVRHGPSLSLTSKSWWSSR